MKFKKYILIIAILCFNVVAGFATESVQSQQPSKIASVSTPSFPKEIFKVEEGVPFIIDEENETEEEELMPSSDIYEIWKNKDVNPYKVAIKDLADSISINCTGYVHPLETAGAVTSNYGPRGGRFHYGIDLRVAIGEDVYAAFDGKIRVTGFDKYGYGYYVIIRHSNGLETLYGHLSKIKVEINQDVSAGDLIGLGGNTGRSTGPHLHFEFRYLGNAINPVKLVNFESQKMLEANYTICKNTTFSEILSYQIPKYHVVRSGETLSSIARQHKTTVAKLCKLNNLKTTSILRVKQRLRYS